MHKQPLVGSFHRLASRCPLSSARSDAGFTLIEVLVSALMVVLIGSATATALIAGSHFSGGQRQRSQADELAQQDQERLSGISDQQLNGVNQVPARLTLLDGTSFTVTSSATYLSSTGGSSCSSASGDTAYYKILSDVSWPSNRLTDVKEESVIARPIGGNLLIRVTDETAAGVQGATVSTTGQAVQSAVTDSLGCATFSGLAAGQYTITVTAPGYVDQTGNSAPSTSATVPSSPVTFPTPLGRAGTIAASFTTQAIAGTATCPQTTGRCTGQQADALSWAGTGGQGGTPAPYPVYGPLSAPGAQIPVSTTLQLFPFPKTLIGVTPVDYTANYTVWTGKCALMQPPPTYDTFSVAPASNQILAVQEPALAVLLTYNGTRMAPADVKISFSSTAPPPACSDSWSAPIASDAATDLNGSLQFPGQPYAPSTAPLKICADYMPSGSPPYVSNSTALIPTPNTNFSAPTTVTVALITTSSQTKC